MSEPEPKKLTITVQVYYYATKQDKQEIYSTPRQVEFWSDESLFEKLNRLVPVQFWRIVYDEIGKIWVYGESSNAEKRSQIDDLQGRLTHNPQYRPTFYIWDSRFKADFDSQSPSAQTRPLETGRVAHLSTLLTQLNAVDETRDLLSSE